MTMRGYWKNKKTGSRYKTMEYVPGTNMARVTNNYAKQPYLIDVASLVFVLETK